MTSSCAFACWHPAKLQISTDHRASGLVPNPGTHKHEVTSAEGLWNYRHLIDEETCTSVSNMGAVTQLDSGGARFILVFSVVSVYLSDLEFQDLR